MTVRCLSLWSVHWTVGTQWFAAHQPSRPPAFGWSAAFRRPIWGDRHCANVGAPSTDCNTNKSLHFSVCEGVMVSTLLALDGLDDASQGGMCVSALGRAGHRLGQPLARFRLGPQFRVCLQAGPQSCTPSTRRSANQRYGHIVVVIINNRAGVPSVAMNHSSEISFQRDSSRWHSTKSLK